MTRPRAIARAACQALILLAVLLAPMAQAGGVVAGESHLASCATEVASGVVHSPLGEDLENVEAEVLTPARHPDVVNFGLLPVGDVLVDGACRESEGPDDRSCEPSSLSGPDGAPDAGGHADFHGPVATTFNVGYGRVLTSPGVQQTGGPSGARIDRVGNTWITTVPPDAQVRTFAYVFTTSCPSGGSPESFPGSYTQVLGEPPCPQDQVGVTPPACRTRPPACPEGTVGATPPACVVFPPPPCPQGSLGATPPACRPPPAPCPSGDIGAAQPACVPPPSPCPAGTVGTPPACAHRDPPTAIVSCEFYNAMNGSPYPGQDNGTVVEYAPPGPEGDVALCTGAASGAQCAGMPGVVVNNDVKCAPNPCPQGFNPDKLAACGLAFCAPGVANASATTISACGVGPVCPSGITSPAAPGQIVVVCGQAVSACSLSAGGPAPGWTVGANGACVGLPWVAPGSVPGCPPSARLNARVHWGTTPGFPPGSTFDVCV